MLCLHRTFGRWPIHRQEKDTTRATTAAAIASVVRMPKSFASRPLTCVSMIVRLLATSRINTSNGTADDFSYRLSCRPDVPHPGIMHKLADPHPVKARLNIQMRPRLYCIAGGGAEERSCWLRADIGPGRFGPNGIALRELVQHRLPEEIAPPTYPLIRPSYLLGARHYAPLTTIITTHIHRTDFEQVALTLARLRRAVRVGSLDRQAMAPLRAPQIPESAR